MKEVAPLLAEDLAASVKDIREVLDVMGRDGSDGRPQPRGDGGWGHAQRRAAADAGPPRGARVDRSAQPEEDLAGIRHDERG